MLSATDIHVRLSRTPVLNGASLTARPGEVSVIVGPNGSGKTTLLRAITQEVGFEGEIRLDGEDITALPGWKLAARRAVLPQHSRIAFPFTVAEIVRLGMTAAATPPPKGRVAEALERVGLAGFAGRPYAALSGGEQQRVQLARVLTQVWEPVGPEGARWLLLDEPVSSLDIGHQLEVMELLAGYAAAGGGVVAVMHDLNLTAMYADHVMLMAGGLMQASGAPADVLTDANLTRAYGCALRVNTAPPAPATFLLPHTARPTG
ncbi:heme ABC transporter ATP-binding protein [Vannielia litorea]|uniref:heme ABC transporter ATP-binding protein n=1 Tax=Vannielia litorea TaxID=1217970 RepID=UPI001C96361A|nr:heme ABC transporter ATP-binding protein [Vannielia litorea]MBY6048752.1 heme ABC transporter ATP-binding protein [Vannielia litorea]MBY6076166.1 heme ABC transporter ATP-binding protein [Vannielia litorea]